MDRSKDLNGQAEPAMPLLMAGRGEKVRLADVHGGIGMRQRLAEMGLVPGTEFLVNAGGRTGPVIVTVKGSRLALGRGMVARIFVRPIR